MNMQHMSRLRKTRQAGFTLIELVVVIVILGILAATALPRFFDMSTDARKAAVAGIAGAFTTGVGLEHAKWMVDGASPGKFNATPTGGGTITACTVPGTAAVPYVAATTGASPSPGTAEIIGACTEGATAVIDGVYIGFNGFGYPTNKMPLPATAGAAVTGPVINGGTDVNLAGLMTLTDDACMNIWEVVLAGSRPTLIKESSVTTQAVAYAGGFDWSAKPAGATDVGTPTEVNASCTFTYYGGAKVASARKIVYIPRTGTITLTNP